MVSSTSIHALSMDEPNMSPMCPVYIPYISRIELLRIGLYRGYLGERSESHRAQPFIELVDTFKNTGIYHTAIMHNTGQLHASGMANICITSIWPWSEICVTSFMAINSHDCYVNSCSPLQNQWLKSTPRMLTANGQQLKGNGQRLKNYRIKYHIHPPVHLHPFVCVIPVDGIFKAPIFCGDFVFRNRPL